jgi:predicted N-acyltransferase
VANINEISLNERGKIRGNSFYATAAWLAHVEGSLGQGQFYVTVWDDSECNLLASAPFFLFERSTFAPYDLSTMLGPAMHDRCAVPNVICTAPHGYCCEPFLSTDLSPHQRLATWDLLLSTAEGEARRLGMSALAFLYVDLDGPGTLVEWFTTRGYATLSLTAKNLLPIKWKSFEDYLSSLSRDWRAAVRREIRRFQETGCSVSVEGAEALNDRLALLETNVHHKYGLKTSVDRVRRIHQRARKYLSPFIRVFVAHRENIEVGFSQFYVHEGRYHSGFVGFDYDLPDQSFSYFNVLFYAPIQDAIAHGAAVIDYGIGADFGKVARGCQPSSQIGLYKWLL